MPAAIQWTQEMQDAFVDGILAGKSIESIAKSVGISALSFYRHRLDSPEFEATIARVQEASQEREVDELIDLADTANEDNANAVKLRVWTRMWVAGKRKPKKYGDKIQQEHSGAIDLSLADSISKARKRAEP